MIPGPRAVLIPRICTLDLWPDNHRDVVAVYRTVLGRCSLVSTV